MHGVALNGVPAGKAVAAASVFVAAVAVVAVGGSVAAGSAAEQYGSLVQPAWAPPAWLFAPVWTVLYLGIAFAGWRLWLIARSWRQAHVELSLYVAGLVLNGLWTPLFFAAGAPVAALVDIVLLDVVIAATAITFAARDRLSASVLLPYLAWTLFATALNAAIVVLN